jgi:hypothetical protein
VTLGELLDLLWRDERQPVVDALPDGHSLGTRVD